MFHKFVETDTENRLKSTRIKVCTYAEEIRMKNLEQYIKLK